MLARLLPSAVVAWMHPTVAVLPHVPHTASMLARATLQAGRPISLAASRLPGPLQLLPFAQHVTRSCSVLAPSCAATTAAAPALGATGGTKSEEPNLAAPSVAASTPVADRVDLRPTGSHLLLLGVDPDGEGALAALWCPLYHQLPPGPHAILPASSDAAPPPHATTTDEPAASSAASASKHSRGKGKGKKQLTAAAAAASDVPANGSVVCGEAPALPAAASPAHVDLAAAAIALYDMPRQVVPLSTKTKSGKLRTRKRLDVDAVVTLVQQVLQQHTAAAVEASTAAASAGMADVNGSDPAHSTGSSSSSSSNGNTAGPATLAVGAGQQGSCSNNGNGANSSGSSSTGNCSSSVPCSSSTQPALEGLSPNSSSGSRVVLRAVLELTSGIQPMNGSLSVLNTGYSSGAWHGVLRSLGFEVCTVPPVTWKRDLGLRGASKDDSRAMAGAVFGSCQDLLRRKRDHGRAEALLLAAWGCGLTAVPQPHTIAKAIAKAKGKGSQAATTSSSSSNALDSSTGGSTDTSSGSDHGGSNRWSSHTSSSNSSNTCSGSSSSNGNEASSGGSSCSNKGSDTSSNGIGNHHLPSPQQPEQAASPWAMPGWQVGPCRVQVLCDSSGVVLPPPPSPSALVQPAGSGGARKSGKSGSSNKQQVSSSSKQRRGRPPAAASD